MSNIAPAGTTTIIVRAWNKIAPKVLAYLASGLSAAVIIHIASLFGVVLDPGVAGAIAILVGFVASYFKTDHVLIEAAHPADGDAGTSAEAPASV